MPPAEPILASDHAEDTRLLVAAAEEAGALAMGYFRRDPRTWTKGIDSPVTEADIAVDAFLARRLRAARPDYGWLSEETADNGDRLTRRRAFIVDPIDGTRAFVAGREEWTVSLAVVEDGRPTAAALLAPALARMFRASLGGGAACNGKALQVTAKSDLANLRIAGPRRHVGALADAAGVPISAVRFVPSLAYRVALVAAGEADVAVARPNAHDWDLAACDLLVHEAGGVLVDQSGRQLRYNEANPVHGRLLATSPPLRAQVAALLAEVADAGSESTR